jgi:hypothetical protein
VINISFYRRVDKGFKKFSYVRENRYWPIVRNVRRVTRFEDRGNRAGFPNNGKNSFVEGTLKKKIERIS